VVANARGSGASVAACTEKFPVAGKGVACSAVKDHAGVRDTLNNQLTCGLVLACIASVIWSSCKGSILYRLCYQLEGASCQATCLGQHR
jgi:hypothetical protein